MSGPIKNGDGFSFCPVLLTENMIDNQKTLSIPIKNNRYKRYSGGFSSKKYGGDSNSRSWSGYSQRSPNVNFSTSPVSNFMSLGSNDYARSSSTNRYHRGNTYASPTKNQCSRDSSSTSPQTINEDLVENFIDADFKPFNAIENCKSAGVIPYSIQNGTVRFLFQKAIDPQRKKDSGLNDFGGKKVNSSESTAETAAREFSEETSCLFYLKEHENNIDNKTYYNLLKENENLFYDDDTVAILKKLIQLSQKYYYDKITEFASPINISSKETYISYFVKVPYIEIEDIPRAEDIHISYDVRYIRNCYWYTLEDLMNLNEKDFHKRLQITRIQSRISNYCKKGLFI